MIDRLTEVIATCDDENIYGTASALLKIRDELEKSGTIKNPDALDYFAKTKLESLILTKLGKLEDVEEELGIDLITLIIAFRKGIYDLENGKWYSFSTYELYIDNRLNIHNRKNGKVYHFVDKGISWCLTKEELEK